ncbi:11686_t:CDS:2, partial [Racocetra persica]
LREKYRECMSRIFKEHKEKVSTSDFQMIIRNEQKDFMKRMENVIVIRLLALIHHVGIVKTGDLEPKDIDVRWTGNTIGHFTLDDNHGNKYRFAEHAYYINNYTKDNIALQNYQGDNPVNVESNYGSRFNIQRGATVRVAISIYYGCLASTESDIQTEFETHKYMEGSTITNTQIFSWNTLPEALKTVLPQNYTYQIQKFNILSLYKTPENFDVSNFELDAFANVNSKKEASE